MKRHGFWNLAGLALSLVVTFAPEGNRVLGQQPTTEVKGQVVIAEGTGTSKASALKDAFRNAVIQVVGVVVDAETRVKNDEIIEDKVLTYSDGLVKRWDLVSEKVADGLTRVKIKAEVERRSVVARLRAAGVTVSDVDGGGLFAEIVTDLDAAKKSRALLEAALKDYPFGALEGKVLGKPEIVERDETKAQIRLNLRFDVNHKVYGTVVTRLLNTLKGIARDGGTFVLASKPDERTPGVLRNDATWLKAMPKSFTEEVRNFHQSKQVTLAVMTQLTALQDRSAWSYYLLDESVRETLLNLAALEPKAKLIFLDGEQKVIAVEQFSLIGERNGLAGTAESQLQLLSGLDNWGRPISITHLSKNHRDRELRRYSWFTFCPVHLVRYVENVIYHTQYLRSRTVTLTLDEIRRISTIRCEVILEDVGGGPGNGILKK